MVDAALLAVLSGAANAPPVVFLGQYGFVLESHCLASCAITRVTTCEWEIHATGCARMMPFCSFRSAHLTSFLNPIKTPGVPQYGPPVKTT